MCDVNVKELRHWIPRVTRARFSVIVEGFCLNRNNQWQLWRSTAIVGIRDERTVVSHTGSIYRLIGPISIKSCRRFYYPEHIIEQFGNGFPPFWEETLNELYNFLASDGETTHCYRSSRREQISRPCIAAPTPAAIEHSSLPFNDSVEFICENGLTPLHPSRHNRVPKRSALESSPEEVEHDGCRMRKKKIHVKREQRIQVQPAPKKPRLNLRAAREAVDERLSNVDAEVEYMVEYPESEAGGNKENALANPKARWTMELKKKMQNILNIVNPKDDRDWAYIVQQVGAAKSIEEYKEMAQKLGWKPSKINDSVKSPERTDLDVSLNGCITAKPSTAAYMVQTHKFARQLKGRNNVGAAVRAGVDPSEYPSLNFDDSLLAIAKTPEAARKPRMVGIALPCAAPNMDESRVSSTAANDSSIDDSKQVDDTTMARTIRCAYYAFGNHNNKSRIGNKNRHATMNGSNNVTSQSVFQDTCNALFAPRTQNDRARRLDRSQIAEIDDEEQLFSDNDEDDEL